MKNVIKERCYVYSIIMDYNADAIIVPENFSTMFHQNIQF